MTTWRSHTKRLRSKPGTNQCGEISLGEYQRRMLPAPKDRPQNRGLRSGRDYVVGHMHNRVPNEAVYGIYSGTLTTFRPRYNESRS